MIANTSLQDTLGVGLPKVYFNTFTLSDGGDVRRSIQDPHIDHPNETSVATLDEISDTVKNKSLQIKINLILKETVTQNSTLSFLTSGDILKYIKIAVIQCTDNNLHNSIVANPNNWFKSSLSLSEYSGLTKKVLAINEVTINVLQSDAAGEDITGQPSSNATSLINNMPYARNQDADGNIVYDIGLFTDFTIGPSAGGRNVKFLSYFCYAYFDLNDFSVENQLLGSINLPQDFLDALSIGDPSYELVIIDGNTNKTSFAFLDNQDRYWLGSVHQMEDGSWMKGATHIPKKNIPASEYLTKLEVPNSKIVDNREIINIEQITLDYSKFNDYFTNDEALLAITKSFKTDGILKKKPQVVSDLYITRDTFNNARFMFSVNIHEATKRSTVFPGLLDSIKQKDPVEYNNIIKSAVITDFKIYRQRVRNQEVIQSDINKTSFSTSDSKKLIVNSYDSSGGSLKPVINKTKIKKLKKESVFKIGTIKETGFSIEDNLGIRNFTGTDFDISKQLEGKYEYSVELTVTDPVVPFLVKKAESLLKILNGTSSKALGSTIGLREYYNDAVSSPNNYDTYTNRFTLDFYDFYDKKYNSNNQNGLFLINAISTYIEVLLTMGGNDQENLFDSIRLLDYLLRISSPNTGSPDGINILIKLIEDFVQKIEVLLKSTTAYVKKPQQGISNALGSSPNLLGGTASKTFMIAHDFKNLYDASIPASFGIDYLSISESENLTNDTGLRGFTSAFFKIRTQKEIQKYFAGNAVDISLYDNANQQNANIMNPGDSVDNKRYTFLSPSLVKIPLRPTYSVLSNGSLDQQYEELNDLVLDIVRYNESISRVGTLARGDDQISDAISLQNQKRRFDLINYFADKGATFSTLKAKQSTTNTTAEPTDSSAIASKDLIGLAAGAGLFVNSKNPQTTLGFNNTNILDSPLNPNELLNTLVQINDCKFFSKTNNQFFYNTGLTLGAKTFKDELFAYALLAGLGGGTGEEGQVSDQAPLTRAPNQLKALMLSYVKSPSVNLPSIFNVDTAQLDPLLNPNNFGFIHFNFKNVTKIEVLRSYNIIGSDTFLGEPVWTDLSADDLESLSGMPLFCRHKQYFNLNHGFESLPKLQMPTYNEYFFLVPDSSVIDVVNQAQLSPVINSSGIPTPSSGTGFGLGNPLLMIGQKGDFSQQQQKTQGGVPRAGTVPDFRLKRDKYIEQRVIDSNRPNIKKEAIRNEYTKSVLTTSESGIQNFGIKTDAVGVAKETTKQASKSATTQNTGNMSKEQLQKSDTTKQTMPLGNFGLVTNTKGTTY